MEDKTDMGVALQFVMHLDMPCIDAATGRNIRDTYLRTAEGMLDRLGPAARYFLKGKIEEYSKTNSEPQQQLL